ncbi:hypothetical protein EG329_000313 [Mollisiaceae sp. DMI_Dod_QoI]|nr:hypothetical protein EG329_000313 [Helotiales sp. DMI_Dod_QoI]
MGQWRLSLHHRFITDLNRDPDVQRQQDREYLDPGSDVQRQQGTGDYRSRPRCIKAIGGRPSVPVFAILGIPRCTKATRNGSSTVPVLGILKTHMYEGKRRWNGNTASALLLEKNFGALESASLKLPIAASFVCHNV